MQPTSHYPCRACPEREGFSHEEQSPSVASTFPKGIDPLTFTSSADEYKSVVAVESLERAEWK